MRWQSRWRLPRATLHEMMEEQMHRHLRTARPVNCPDLEHSTRAQPRRATRSVAAHSPREHAHASRETLPFSFLTPRESPHQPSADPTDRRQLDSDRPRTNAKIARILGRLQNHPHRQWFTPESKHPTVRMLTPVRDAYSACRATGLNDSPREIKVVSPSPRCAWTQPARNNLASRLITRGIRWCAAL